MLKAKKSIVERHRKKKKVDLHLFRRAEQTNTTIGTKIIYSIFFAFSVLQSPRFFIKHSFLKIIKDEKTTMHPVMYANSSILFKMRLELEQREKERVLRNRTIITKVCIDTVFS